MELATGFVIYLIIFRLAIIAAGVVCIVAGYLLFKHGFTQGDKTELEGHVGKYRLSVRNAAPGTCFALFGAFIITANFIDGGPGLTMKTLEKVSAFSTHERSRQIEPVPKSEGQPREKRKVQEKKAATRSAPVAKNSRPLSTAQEIETLTELKMKGTEQDAFIKFIEKAKSLERNNRKAEAIRSYESALLILGEPINNLAYLYNDAGKSEQAVLLASIAAIICPEQAGFQHTYAKSLWADGNRKESVKVMEKAARLSTRYEDDLRKLREEYGQP